MCRLFKWAFAVAYLAALFLLAVGTWGWFGAERDPLSGVFLILLGLPWNLFIDSLAKGLRLCWPLWRPPLTWPFSFQSAPLCVGGDLFISRVFSRILFFKCLLLALCGH